MVHPKTEQAYKLLHDGVLALARAEQQGIRVDLEYIEDMKYSLDRRMERLERRFKSTSLFQHWQHTVKGKININSNPQLAHFLYVTKKIKPPKETISGQGATDEEALQLLDIPELQDLLELRKLKKVRDTYLDAFAREQVQGYIHPFFNLHLVRTYRSSSDHPNFQNIPKRDEESMRIVRQALFPRPGHQLLEVDYSGLEVRIAACYHKDTTMLQYIRDPKSDMHADMAKQIFIVQDPLPQEFKVLRQAAKNGFVFPEFYGDYYGNCAINLASNWCKLPQQGKWKAGDGIPFNGGTIADHLLEKGLRSMKDFETHLQKIEEDFWGVRFVEYARWKDRWYTVYKKYGYVDLLTGFRCSGVMGRNDVINYPVQGAAFHCLLWSFIRLDQIIREEGLQTRLVGQIHDSMLLDVHPKELDYICQIVHRVTCEDLPKAWEWIIVPLDVEMELCGVDESWSEKKKYTFK